MEYLKQRVRIDKVEIPGHGRAYAGRVGRIEGFTREPGRGGMPGGIRAWTVRFEDGERIEVGPGHVRFLYRRRSGEG